MQDTRRRPDLLAHTPEPLIARLRPHGIVPRALAWQPTLRQPSRGRWGSLPHISGSPIIDLSYLSVCDVAMTLVDLRQEQCASSLVPFILVPGHSVALHRLIAASRLTAFVSATTAPADLLARWLTSPLVLPEGLVWVDLAPPDHSVRSPHSVALLAALSRAETIEQAARWCALSRRRAYEVLATVAEQLDLPPRPWRSTRLWTASLVHALTRPAVRPLAVASLPHKLTKEPAMNAQRFDVVAAMLCGCVIEAIHQQGTRVTLDVDEPRLGRMTLICEDATFLSPSSDYADFTRRAVWQRKVDWADLVESDVFAIYFASGDQLMLHMRSAAFEHAAAK
jgi:hypothetical protein